MVNRYTVLTDYIYLASRQVFAKKTTTPVNSSSVASEEEPFSASEAEFEPETTTTPATEAPAAEAPAERSVAAEAAPAEAQAPSSPFAKSIYSNVVNFLTRKDKEAAPAPAPAAAQPEEVAAEAAPEAAPEAAAEPVAEAAPEAEAEAPVVEETPAAEEAIEEAPVATEDKVEAAEEPVEEAAEKAAEPAEEAPATENKPSRVKSFFSKEHNGLFKFFNKKTGETTVVKGPIENHEAHPDGELVPITQEEAQQVEAANSAAEAEVAAETVEEAPAAEVAEVAAEEPKVEEVKPKEVKTPLLQRIVSFTKGKSEPTSPAQATEKAVSAAASPVPEAVAEATTSEAEPVAEAVSEEPVAASEEAPAAEAAAEEPAADSERAADAPAEEAAASAEPHESSLQRAMSMILKGFHHEKKAEGEAPAADAEAATTEEPAEVVAEPETSEAAVVTEEPAAEAETEVAAKEVDAEAADADVDADAAATSPQRKASMFARLGEYAYNAVSGTAAEAEVDESTPSPLAEKIDAAIKHGALLKQGYVLRSLETRYFILGADGVLRYYHSNRDAGEGKKIELNEGVQLKKAEPKFIDIVTKARGYRFVAKDAEERDEWIEVLSKFATLEVPAPVAEQAEAETEEAETPAQVSDETVETAEAPSEAVTAEASTDAVPPVAEEETKAVEPAAEAPVAPEVKAQAA
jgi:hypothetical protein